MNNSLTSFRAFAVIAVFFYHAGMFDEGYLGVQAFFVLSGFLLTPILISMKKEPSYKKYMMTFSGRRILRIFPLYFLYLLMIYLIVTRVFFANGMYHPQLETFLLQLPWAATFSYNIFMPVIYFLRVIF